MLGDLIIDKTAQALDELEPLLLIEIYKSLILGFEGSNFLMSWLELSRLLGNWKFLRLDIFCLLKLFDLIFGLGMTFLSSFFF